MAARKKISQDELKKIMNIEAFEDDFGTEAVVLGIRKKGGDYFLIDENHPSSLTHFNDLAYIEAPYVVPYNINYPGEFLGKYVFLKVRIDITSEEMTEYLIGGADLKSVKRARAVFFIEEIDNPLEYTYGIYKRKAAKRNLAGIRVPKEKNNLEEYARKYGDKILSDIINYWVMFGIMSGKELLVYKELLKAGIGIDYLNLIPIPSDVKACSTIMISEHNYEHLPEFMDVDGSHIRLTSFHSKDYSPYKEELLQMLRKLNEDDFIKFHLKTNRKHILELNVDRINERFYRELLRKEYYSTYRIAPLLIPEFSMKNVGADLLLKDYYSESYQIFSDDNFDNEDYDKAQSKLIGVFSEILRNVTEESLPFLQTMRYDTIKKFVPQNVLDKLKS